MSKRSTDHRIVDGSPESFDRELDIKTVVVSGALLLLVVGVSMWLMWLMVEWGKGRDIAADVSPLPEAQGTEFPDAPLLQAYPERDLHEFRDESRVRATTPGWIDEEQKIIRVPVESAVEWIFEEGASGLGALPPLEAEASEPEPEEVEEVADAA